MDQRRIAEATEADAKALHESVREKHQFKWETMTQGWRAELRDYVRPAVIAALHASDQYLSRERRNTRHPKIAPAQTTNE